MPPLLFSSSSPKHIFSPAESFLLIFCCFSKTRQFGAINQTEFGPIIVKCKMRSQHAFFVVVFLPKAGPVLHYPPESNALWCSAPHRIRGDLSLLLSLLVWVSELATRDRIEHEQGLLYVLPVMTPSWCVCSAYRKQTSRQERKLYACFPFTPV